MLWVRLSMDACSFILNSNFPQMEYQLQCVSNDTKVTHLSFSCQRYVSSYLHTVYRGTRQTYLRLWKLIFKAMLKPFLDL